MVVAVVLLVVVYALIMTETIHRTSAALLGASLGVAALSILNMVTQMKYILYSSYYTHHSYSDDKYSTEYTQHRHSDILDPDVSVHWTSFCRASIYSVYHFTGVYSFPTY